MRRLIQVEVSAPLIPGSKTRVLGSIRKLKVSVHKQNTSDEVAQVRQRVQGATRSLTPEAGTSARPNLVARLLLRLPQELLCVHRLPALCFLRLCFLDGRGSVSLRRRLRLASIEIIPAQPGAFSWSYCHHSPSTRVLLDSLKLA